MMERLLLRMFRLAIVVGALLWVVEAGDLSQQAQGFVETQLAGWSRSIER
jgi:hypothetical protein